MVRRVECEPALLDTQQSDNFERSPARDFRRDASMSAGGSDRDSAAAEGQKLYDHNLGNVADDVNTMLALSPTIDVTTDPSAPISN